MLLRQPQTGYLDLWGMELSLWHLRHGVMSACLRPSRRKSTMAHNMAVRSLKLFGGGGGAVRGSEGHPAADDDLASEKGHLLAKRALFPRLPGGQLATVLHKIRVTYPNTVYSPTVSHVVTYPNTVYSPTVSHVVTYPNTSILLQLVM